MMAYGNITALALLAAAILAFSIGYYWTEQMGAQGLNNTTSIIPNFTTTNQTGQINCGAYSYYDARVTGGQMCFVSAFEDNMNATLMISYTGVDAGTYYTMNTQRNGTLMQVKVNETSYVIPTSYNENATIYCGNVTSTYNYTSGVYNGMMLSSCTTARYFSNSTEPNQSAIFFAAGRNVSGMTRYISPGQRISNFLVEEVNAANITGLLYQMYPLARISGVPQTLRIGDHVGYSCDGTFAQLVAIKGGEAVFMLDTTKYGVGCPV